MIAAYCYVRQRYEGMVPIKKGLFRKTVDHVKAVDGIDLTVRAGQTIGVVEGIRFGQDNAWSRAFPYDRIER